MMSLRCMWWIAVLVLAPAVAVADIAKDRASFQQAWRAMNEGRAAVVLAPAMQDYPLYPYLAYERMRKAPGKASFAEIEAFLADHGDSLIGERLRQQTLQRLAQAGRHGDFLKIYRAERTGVELQCHAFAARQALKAEGDRDAEALDLIERLDRDHAACRPALAQLKTAGALTPDWLATRIDRAMDQGHLGVARWLLAELPATRRPAFERRILAHADANQALTQAANWPANADSARAVAVALARRARSDPAAADARLQTLSTRMPFADADRWRVEREIARFAAVEGVAEAERWIRRLPVEGYDDNLHEWVVRLRLRRGDLAAALEALQAMPEPLASDGRWRYAQARVLELLERADEARPIYTTLANEATFHGFLAADRIDAAYAICPADALLNAQRAVEVLALPALRRSLEWRALGDEQRARAEWFWLMPRLDTAQRRELGLIASREGLHEWAIFTLNSGDLMRQYDARFPLLHQNTVAIQAKRNELPKAWVLGLIRAESAWNPNARSSVGARGLMQLMPGTARDVAKSLGLSAEPLHDPDHNIRLGSRYLSRRLSDLDKNPVLATAAYNAGIGAVKRWLKQPAAPPWDLWIETIPFKETREYVARVMAFTVLYDWRLDGSPARVSTLIPGLAPARSAPAPVVCPK